MRSVSVLVFPTGTRARPPVSVFDRRKKHLVKKFMTRHFGEIESMTKISIPASYRETDAHVHVHDGTAERTKRQIREIRYTYI